MAEIHHWYDRLDWQLRTLIAMLALFAVSSAWLAHLARRVLAWPLAFVCVWLGVAWGVKGWVLKRKSQRTAPVPPSGVATSAPTRGEESR